ncbi:hypothetical protein DITRI_Ditri11bG0103900 [Diplodiscus trichospermus]
MDAKYMVEAITKGHQDLFEYGSLIFDSISLLKNDEGFSIHFVRRQVNEITHA